ncbi:MULTISPECIES: flagellar hook protein FlgE [Comamonas]|uniref:Flagellar hook protein FlgE n=1 Tax=Comamonas terrigena TaxID=32013 RepID=A0A2A7US12_COMTR|nr:MULTISPECIES: flagellar hook protein FlgE [Comamonas]MBD9533859.1 flagellar hook protein FlgE [Comamonas sp. CMM01]PEH88034.1 flagellar hook protein FlgE [Comamonas terrigena]BBL22945.1 flagellar hook protein FlgE [Comamonas terrigena NBRC 13299]SUY92100.1 Flagellar hook protein flgE [Comamonas terrigena]
MGFYHGLSGLNASSKNLDVIGHNIANSNTSGFKSSRAEFNEMVASAMGAASGSNAGIGVSVAAVSQQFSQGVIVPTNNGLDMAINGDGFFVVNTSSGMAYTRSGNFQLTKNGELQTVNGDKVMGYTVDPLTGQRNSVALTELTFPTGAPIPAKQTTSVAGILNLDARANLAAGDATATPPIEPTPRATYGTSLQVYDSLGVAHPASVYFEKTGPNSWEVYDSLTATDPIGTLTFNTDGTLASATPAPPAAPTDPFELTITPTTGAASPFAVKMDLSKATQFGSAWSVAKLTQDGYASGELTSVNVSKDGTLMASYSNGVTRAEAQIALAKFTNSQGLIPDGNNNWLASNDSGPAVYGSAGSGSFGDIQGNALEESNVDLTAELVNMMTAQRAYQANAQTIKTQDQIFSTLVNLR